MLGRVMLYKLLYALTLKMSSSCDVDSCSSYEPRPSCAPVHYVNLYSSFDMFHVLPWMKRAFITRVMQPPNHSKPSSHHIDALATRREMMWTMTSTLDSPMAVPAMPWIMDRDEEEMSVESIMIRRFEKQTTRSSQEVVPKRFRYVLSPGCSGYLDNAT